MKSVLKKCGAIIGALILLNGMASYAFANTEVQQYKIDTLEALKQELNTYEAEDCRDVVAQKRLVNNTNPEVLQAYIEEKSEMALDALNKIDPDSVLEENADGTLTGKTTVDLGDGCTMVVELEDGEDKALLASIRDAIFEPAYAATNGEEMWKDYGNRYFTAKTTILTGIGGCVCRLENHYTLSAKGIDERYGDAYEKIGFSIGITGNVTHDSVIISDASARTPGSSDVNMYVRFNWNYNGAGVVAVQGSTKLTTTVGYVDINKTKKQIKVKHSWSVS